MGCISVIIGSGIGLAPILRQTITWTGVDLLSMSTLETNVNKRYHSRKYINTFEYRPQNVDHFVKGVPSVI